MRDPWKKLLANIKISGRQQHRASTSKVFLKENKGPKYTIEVTPNDLENMFNKQGGKCYWFNIDIEPQNLFIPYHPLAPSVDRLCNDKGYTKDNIIICSRMANLGRGIISPQEFVSVVKTIYEQVHKDPLYINKLQKKHHKRTTNV